MTHNINNLRVVAAVDGGVREYALALLAGASYGPTYRTIGFWQGQNEAGLDIPLAAMASVYTFVARQACVLVYDTELDEAILAKPNDAKIAADYRATNQLAGYKRGMLVQIKQHDPRGSTEWFDGPRYGQIWRATL